MNHAQLRAVLGQVRKLVDAWNTASQNDRILLRAFTATTDQTAFTALVQRNGPMVLNVCRHAQHHMEDAEDVFQAAFLLLADKGTSLGKLESLAGWLYGLAFHVAWRAASRQRRHEW
jgi:DNA-directed RNA polymerase specialized sigma24 family protein